MKKLKWKILRFGLEMLAAAISAALTALGTVSCASAADII